MSGKNKKEKNTRKVVEYNKGRYVHKEAVKLNLNYEIYTGGILEKENPLYPL